MKTYEPFNTKPQWFQSVAIHRMDVPNVGQIMCVLFESDPAQPLVNIRLTAQQLNTIRCNSNSLRKQRNVDNSREQVFRLLECYSQVHIVPHELEQDTAPVDVKQKRMSCYTLVLDVISKAMENAYGIQTYTRNSSKSNRL